MDSTQKTIAIFGASNVDVMGFPINPLIFGDANVGTSVTAPGGVGRNIAENLTRLEMKVELVSVFGDDPLSEYLIKSCKKLGLSIKHSLRLENKATASFLAVMDHQNDLAVGISAMDIYENIPLKIFQRAFDTIPPTDYLVLETNFQTEILEFIASKKENSKLIMDTVSGKKAIRAIPILGDLYMLKTNLIEAKMICDIPIEKIVLPELLIETLLNKGVQNVFITMGKDGVIYGNKNGIEHQNPIPSSVKNTVGAGDSFVSGIIYADALGLPMAEIARYGMAAAAINVKYNGAVSPEMNVKNLTQPLKLIKMNLLEIHPEVQNALAQNKPIVALESTIISHGMPFPQNLETALMLEQEVRNNGAIPATIALINGKIKVGLTVEEITTLAKEGLKVHKTSRRDMAYVLAQKITGSNHCFGNHDGCRNGRN